MLVPSVKTVDAIVKYILSKLDSITSENKQLDQQYNRKINSIN